MTPSTLGRRIETTSWRSEYIARVSLLRCARTPRDPPPCAETDPEFCFCRQWHRARTPTLIHNPSLGAINLIYVHLPTTSALPAPSGTRTPNGTSASSATDSPSLTATPMLSVSLAMGAAVHSSPFTGKVSKRPLVASPVDHLDRPVGLPIVAATSFALSNDGTRLVWGMRDGSLRFSNSAPPGGGRGVAGGVVEQGEVRSLDEAHRPGSAVQLVAFSNLGGAGAGKVVRTEAKQRPEVFVSAAADGSVAIWTLATAAAATTAATNGGGARERPPPAIKLWQARWDLALDAPAPTASSSAQNGTAALTASPPVEPRGPPNGRRVKATAIAFDSGWLGRHHGRSTSVAIGRSDGRVIVWRGIDLDGCGSGATSTAVAGPQMAREEDAIVLTPLEAGRAVDVLVMDLAPTTTTTTQTSGSGAGSLLPPATAAPLSLLVHQTDSRRFSRYHLDATSTSRTVFGHPEKDELAALTAFAVDFDDAPPLPASASGVATPAEGKVVFPVRPAADLSRTTSSTSTTTTGAVSSMPPALSRSSSGASLSLPPFQPIRHHAAGSRFGRRKFVAAGDTHGRVYLWDWETNQDEAEREREEIVGPAALVQGLEIEGGASASKVTALELTEAGVFVGGQVGVSRCKSIAHFFLALTLACLRPTVSTAPCASIRHSARRTSPSFQSAPSEIAQRLATLLACSRKVSLQKTRKSGGSSLTSGRVATPSSPRSEDAYSRGRSAVTTSRRKVRKRTAAGSLPGKSDSRVSFCAVLPYYHRKSDRAPSSVSQHGPAVPSARVTLGAVCRIRRSPRTAPGRASPDDRVWVAADVGEHDRARSGRIRHDAFAGGARVAACARRRRR